jgi:hypothetical protein
LKLDRTSFFKLDTTTILILINKYKQNLFESDEHGQNEIKPKAKEIYVSIIENWKRICQACCCDVEKTMDSEFDFETAEQHFENAFIKIRRITKVKGLNSNLRVNCSNTEKLGIEIFNPSTTKSMTSETTNHNSNTAKRTSIEKKESQKDVVVREEENKMDSF